MTRGSSTWKCQVADYSRFVAGARRAVLLAERPRPDLMSLVHGEGIAVVWWTAAMQPGGDETVMKGLSAVEIPFSLTVLATVSADSAKFSNSSYMLKK